MASDAIPLPEAPTIPGLSFRHFRGAGDYPHIAAIMRAAGEADGTEQSTTVEEVANLFNNLTNCDPYTDMIFAEVDRGKGNPVEVIGYASGQWRQEDSGLRVYFITGCVTPDWRRRGIGGVMLSWVERRHLEIAAGHPAEIRKCFEGFAAQGEVGLAAMLEKAGYQKIRYFYEMIRPDLENIPDFPLPDGLELRPALPEHYRQIWEADVESFRDHWGFIEPSEKDYQAWLNDPALFQPHLWQIAWDTATNQVAGQVRTFINHEQNALYQRKRGYTEDISVRRPWRRRGLARALIARSLRVQKEAGMTESALDVDVENTSGALRVYEDCGFRPVKRSTLYQKAFVISYSI